MKDNFYITITFVGNKKPKNEYISVRTCIYIYFKYKIVFQRF